jgi:hypothetical protein
MITNFVSVGMTIFMVVMGLKAVTDPSGFGFNKWWWRKAFLIVVVAAATLVALEAAFDLDEKIAVLFEKLDGWLEQHR